MSSDVIPKPRATQPVGHWFAALPVNLPRSWMDTLRQGAPHGLRWYEVEDCHITIAFFGKYRADRLEAVREVLAQMASLDLAVATGGLKLLPSERRFSAIALRLAEEPVALLEFMRQWSTRLAEAAEVAPDPRPPLPHITVARPGRRNSLSEQHVIASWALGWMGPAVKIHLGRVALYRWAEDRSVSQFRIVE